MISEKELIKLYLEEGKSMKEISSILQCSVHKIDYWMDRYGIKRRSISEAIYKQNNPNGNPFKFRKIISQKDAKLLGLGLGLYWGEGNKANKHSVRLGNTDPELIKVFMDFLINICGVQKDKLRFGLQIFSDIKPQKALTFWVNKLGVSSSQFYKITVTISGSIGNYRTKSSYGVVTIYFHNKKLRDILVDMLPR